MNVKQFTKLGVAIVLLAASCKTSKLEFISPQSGNRVVYGESVTFTLNFPTTSLDSVVYSVDGSTWTTKTDTSSLTIDSRKLGLGDKSISARFYAGGKEEIAYSSVLVLPPAAKNYTYEVVNVFSHDSTAFTQGLQFDGGILYETTGRHGESSLRKVDLVSGKVLKKVSLEDKYFGEGMTIVDNKIVFLTWQSGIAFIYDKNSFERLSSFNYNNSKEGWGITYDGQNLIKSDGSNKLYFLDKSTGQETRLVNVYDENGPVDNLNELEYIDGKVYANVYQKEEIVIINPEVGAVEGRINLVGMYNNPNRTPYDMELNGIAYDHHAERLFVTGKLWNKLFEIKLNER